jgi:hypothetical protein
MPSPSVAWTDIASTDLDPDSPITTSLMTALYGNTVHVRETVRDPAIGSAVLAHAHTGDDGSAVLWPPYCPNLITDCQPETGGSDTMALWKLGGALYDSGQEGLVFGASGDFATHVMGDAVNPSYSKTIFGTNGADLVLAICVKATGALSAGKIEFGITDGHTGTFKTGTKAAIPTAAIGAGWARFWTMIPRYHADGHATDCRLGIKCSETPSGGLKIKANLMLVVPSAVLTWWVPGANTDAQSNWHHVGTGSVPVWDQKISFDDATYIDPV